MTSKIMSIDIPRAPLPKGPYSQVISAGDFLFVSGQGAIDPVNNNFSFGDIRHETAIVLENIRRILEGCGSSLADIVKCSVFLSEAADFAAMNDVYASYFGEPAPTRTTVVCAFVQPGMKVEIDCIAYNPQSRS